MGKIHRLRDFSDEVNHWRSREEKNFSLGVQSIYPLSAWLENPPAWTNTHACRAEGVWHDCKQHCPCQQIILSLNQIPRGIFLSVTCLDALVFTCLSDVLTDCFYFNRMVRMLCLIIKTGVENLVWELTGRAGYIYIYIYTYIHHYSRWKNVALIHLIKMWSGIFRNLSLYRNSWLVPEVLKSKIAIYTL